ncbi:glycosyltransferase [Actinophytocola oryzae]|uniref:O-mycaminosyltylonolide 6-deoxyallosyltransferase n=1 Tax=Actinophytocola oryzae TaxID=502181 RepID=A0A4R7VFF1_9PSEU|nr:glycosyltransferase [Actinophytocola oryzae]TDV47973.1 O-mycaminosyltylonolide 6-deoxyallosyltransferase [Actinophytocola oryzae]
MRLTMLTFGTRGDVQPLVALGVTLRARGHDVAIGTAPSFAGLVAGAGLDFRPVEPPSGMREDLFTQPGMNAAIRKGPSFVRTVRSVTPPTDDEIVTMFTGMAQATADADLVVTAPVTHIAGFVGDKPWCSVSWIPANRTREFPAYQAKPRFGGAYNGLTHWFFDTFQWTSQAWMANKYLKATGRPALRGRSRLAELGRDRPVLYPFSRAVVPKPADWPDLAHITGYWFYDRPEWTPDPELAAFLDRGAPLLLTLGSTWPVHDGDRTVDLALGAARAAGLPLLVVGGPERGLPSDAFRTTEVDYGALMPLCAAVVHHGGCGTAGAALRAGIPQVAIPAVFDNPFWAARMHALGVSGPPVPLTALTEESLTASVAIALGDHRLRDRAVELGVLMAEETGLATAADLVERWHARTEAVA